MKKDIYKITNKINGKIYIGQSVDPEYRFRKHKEASKRNRTYECILYDAMAKYGVENFEMEIIEKDIENYNEREIYWIKQLNSLRPNGYNIAAGGDWYPHQTGIHHHSATIKTQEDLLSICEELQFGTLTQEEIGILFNVSQEIVSYINIGKFYRLEGYDYPLRKTFLSQEEVYNLQQDLIHTDLSYQEIADKYNISKVQVKTICYGKSWYNENYKYPLRENNNFNSKDNLDIVEQIRVALLNTKDTFGDIAQQYGCSKTTVSRINNGTIDKNANYQYPIRKSKFLDDETVEDIYKDLIANQISINSIALKYNTSAGTIKNINNGLTKRYYKPEYNYPLR